MREIKFRFYDPQEKRMLTSGMEVDFTGKLCVFMGENECPLMQFTGILDKNGKEIYEGDMLRGWNENIKGFEENLYVMDTFKDGTYWASHKNAGVHESYLVSGSVLASKGRFEIIGNIYENPELCTIS